MKNKYYHSPASVDEYIQMAEGVDSGLLIDKFKTFVPRDSSILELGSGPGTDWGILNQYFNVTGSDYSQEFFEEYFDILVLEAYREFVEGDSLLLIGRKK